MTGIHISGQRVIVTDVQESLFWVRYRRNENQLIIFADDTYPRWVTTACLLDYDTMASADKFGNISIVSTEGGGGARGPARLHARFGVCPSGPAAPKHQRRRG